MYKLERIEGEEGGRVRKIGKHEDLANKEAIVAVNMSTGISTGSTGDKYFILHTEKSQKKMPITTEIYTLMASEGEC